MPSNNRSRNQVISNIRRNIENQVITPDTVVGNKPLLITSIQDLKSYDLAKFLLENGANPNISGSDGSKPMHLAVLEDTTDFIQLLLDYNADINARDSMMKTPLIYCAETGNYTTAEYILDRGANIDLQDEYGMTATMYAVQDGHEDIVRVILEHNYNGMNHFRIRNTDGYSLTNYASFEEYYNPGIQFLLGSPPPTRMRNIPPPLQSQNRVEILTIPKGIIADTKTDSFFNYIMETYKPEWYEGFHFEGQSAVNAEGLSRIVFERLFNTYYDKYLDSKEDGKFYIPKFPISNEMIHATEIMVELAKKTGIKFLISIPNSLFKLLELPTIAKMKKYFNPKNSNYNSTLLANKKTSINNLTNNYARNVLAHNSKENAISGYIQINENHLKNNKKWNNLSNAQKKDYYFQNYLNYLGIESTKNFNELIKWFHSIPESIRTNNIPYNANSVMPRITFHNRASGRNTTKNNTISINSSNYKKKFPNAYTLYRLLTEGTDKDRMNFITFATGTKFSLSPISILCFGSTNDRVFMRSHTCFNTVDVFEYNPEKFNFEMIREIIHPSNDIIVED